MRIVQISTCDLRGGAALAAFRLNQALRQAGYDSHMLVRHKLSNETSVLQIDIDDSNPELAVALSTLQLDCINQNRTKLSNTPFTLAYPGILIDDTDYLNNVDIINLHWVAYLQSPYSLKRLTEFGKPVLWTLHDMWAFTGGCHYSAGCQNYQHSCAHCPQLVKYQQLPQAILSDKLKALDSNLITVVAPSQWLADCARKSQLFKNSRIEVIPNSINTSSLYPTDKFEAREALRIPNESLVFLFGSDVHTEIRKGYQYLIKALMSLSEHLSSIKEPPKICFMHFGKGDIRLELDSMQVIELGYLNSEKDLRNAYSAADMFILPSTEDNLPNTLLEAMSCGLPIMASQSGGIPEIVRDGVHGRLFSSASETALFKTLLQVIEAPSQLKAMSKNCRSAALEKYSFSVQANNYSKLYSELLESSESWQKQQLSSCRKSFVRTKQSILFGKSFQDFFSSQAPLSTVRILESERQKLLKSNLILENKLNKLGAENQHLIDKNSNLADENSNLVDEISNLTDEISNLKNESANLKTEIAQIYEQLQYEQSKKHLTLDNHIVVHVLKKIKATVKHLLQQLR